MGSGKDVTRKSESGGLYGKVENNMHRLRTAKSA